MLMLEAPDDVPPGRDGRRSGPAGGARANAWWWLVVVCGLVLVGVTVLAAASWTLTRTTRVTTYRVLGTPTAVELRVDGDVTIDGGASALVVRRRDTSSFAHGATERRSVVGGVLRLSARCPTQVLGGCAVAYGLSLPDNVPVRVSTPHGQVSLDGVKAPVVVNSESGSVRTRAFCGSSLRVTTLKGGIVAVAECSPESMELRSGSGDVDVRVPAGRYRVDAQGAAIRGITASDDAAFSLQALSASGRVRVEGTT